MNSNNKTWQNVKAGYLHQVEKALALVSHPRKQQVLKDIQAHLEQRFSELSADEQTWENMQKIVADMGPSSVPGTVGLSPPQLHESSRSGMIESGR